MKQLYRPQTKPLCALFDGPQKRYDEPSRQAFFRVENVVFYEQSITFFFCSVNAFDKSSAFTLSRNYIFALFYVHLGAKRSPYTTFGEQPRRKKFTEGKGINMEKKTVRCTFYGLRSIYDVDLRDQMHDAIKKVVEENESIEFLIYLKDSVNLMFLTEAMLFRTSHPEKNIKVIKVGAPDDEHPVNENTMKRLSFLNRYDPDLPLGLFDGLVIADEYSGKAKKDNPGYMMHRVHSIQRWVFAQCDTIFTYDYAAFADSESFEIDILRKNKDKTVIELGSKRTEERIIELAEGLDEKRKDILKRLWEGASYAQIAIKYNYGVSAEIYNHVKTGEGEHYYVDNVCACGKLETIDATAMTADELKAAVADQLAAGETDITVTLKPDAPAEMITAIRRAICDTEGVADGSIHLTLKGVTTIPGTTNWDGVAFGPRNAQWDENNVEIVSHEEVTQLASINLPDVTEIGAQAFLDCSNLTSITAPKVQSIGDWGLQSTAITSIDMPLLKEAGYSAFCRTALTEVSLPSLETAGVIVFGHCEQLRTVDLPKLQNLSQQLFTRCTSLVSVSAPAATSMGINVFKGCSELVSITLPGVTELTNEAFAECTKLENITLGSVITSVNVNLFAGEALSSGITLTLHPDQANAEGDLKATAGTNVEWGGFTWKEVKFSATE